MIESVFLFFRNSVLSKSEDSDTARKELILNILLLASIILIFIGTILHIISLALHLINADIVKNNVLSFLVLIFVFGLFLFLYGLSRRGYINPASYSFLLVFFLLAVHMGWKWGVDVNAGLLLYALIIIMSGILINTRFAFFVTGLIFITVSLVGYGQESGFIEANQYWRHQKWSETDTIMMGIIFLVIATVSWLSNRELERALLRARVSEAELKKERDLLEVKVEERTRELKEAQLERMSQMYRFAEFGKLSSGAFHDMTNLLTALSLNMEQVRNYNYQAKNLNAVKSYLDKATEATKRIGFFIKAVRKQMSGQEVRMQFFLNEEIEQVLEILSYKARLANVLLNFIAPSKLALYGDPVKFNQVVTNLISNAIDSYDLSPEKENRKVEITFEERSGDIILVVKDYGAGISEKIREKIFDPFFTTKDFSQGTGIGLSLVKTIVENDFGGSVQVQSDENEYTKFVIKFPKNKNL